MAASEQLAKFLELSAALTGFSVVELQATGLGATYLDEVTAIVGDSIAVRLWATGSLAASWPGRPESQLRLRVLEDPDLGPVARNLIVLWYTGGWTQLPAAWRDRNGASTRDCDRVLSAEAFTGGLVWPAIHAHPPGARATGFASWVDLPPGLRP
jgi:hypothetical protein